MGVEVLSFDALWLTLAEDPRVAMGFPNTVDSLKVSSSKNVEAREMAGGSVRVVRRSGQNHVANPVFPECSPEQIAWLRQYEGQLICFRDHQGTKLYGFYATVPEEKSTSVRDESDVELSITSATFSEAV